MAIASAVVSWWAWAWIAVLSLWLAFRRANKRERAALERARREHREPNLPKLPPLPRLPSGPYSVTLTSFDRGQSDELLALLARFAATPLVDLSGDPKTVLRRVADRRPETLVSRITEENALAIKEAFEARGAHVRIVRHEPGVPRDTDIIDLLCARDGIPTIVELRSGQLVRVLDIAWGYDIGDEYAHITTNISPGADGWDVDFFHTSDVVSIHAENGATLYPQAP